MTEYQHLDPQTLPTYLRSREGNWRPAGGDVDVDDLASIEEVGDGNLNLVFIVKDRAGRGVVVKQALPYVRLVGPDWPMTPERSRHEHNALGVHAALAPELVPRVYDVDEPLHAIVMEDLSDHRVWRGMLNEGDRTDGVAEALGTYVAAYAVGTSPLVLDPDEHKRSVGATVNPELCRITEDLVFTEPYVDIGRNSVDPANERDAAELAADAAMVAEMAHGRWLFMTTAEALIHGDLHTGSVMVRAGSVGQPPSVKAIDPEFAFYGPLAFDLGALWANYVIAAARATALGDADRAAWCLDLAPRTWSSFESAFRAGWTQRREPRFLNDGFAEGLLRKWRDETWLFAAAKMARRIVGLAKTSDIETLDPDVKPGAARAVLRSARAVAVERHRDSAPERFVSVVGEILAANATV